MLEELEELIEEDKNRFELAFGEVTYQPRPYRIESVMNAVYDYGIAGREMPEHPIDILTDAADFVERRTNKEKFPHCEEVVLLALSRWDFDEQRPLRLKQIALLADMSEASVRNAAHPQARNRLITFKKLNETYVEAEHAKDWLSRRKNFSRTEG